MSLLRRADEIAEDRAALDADPGWEDRVLSPPTLAELLGEILKERTPERIAELRAMDYRAEYLHTPEWKVTRRSAIFAANHRCQRCGLRVRLLDVHHLSYDRLGDELPADLVVLCRPCHKLQHRENG